MSPPSSQQGFNPVLEYQGDDATTNTSSAADPDPEAKGASKIKVEEELVLKALSKLLEHCGMPVPLPLQHLAAKLDEKTSSLLGDSARNGAEQ